MRKTVLLILSLCTAALAEQTPTVPPEPPVELPPDAPVAKAIPVAVRD